jgi:hypothetical protein
MDRDARGRPNGTAAALAVMAPRLRHFQMAPHMSFGRAQTTIASRSYAAYSRHISR